jgi:putative CocE/NonD family hydrolase
VTDRIRTDFPRRVREIEHAWIPLSDGTRLAARIWLPEDAEDDPVPALLEYLPYRKTDGTAVRDAKRQPYLAGHGYAAVRVDMRGTGESDGTLEDEYTEQEQEDALEVIAWLAEQRWCSGGVGVWGISWGGFNALQIAAHRPPALKAIMTLCSSDDRYADDVHYKGGCVLALDMLHWASSMLTWMARPPDPRLAGDGWHEQWLERLEALTPWIEPWLAHQRRDEYWQQGSVCDDYSAIECPVYAVGGFVDGYTNSVPRLLEGLSAPRKGLIGPWAHAFPDDALPGPSIGFLQESVRWFDHWLKGIDTGIMDEPMLRVWLQDSVRPRRFYDVRPGRWAAEAEWPSPRIERQIWELAFESPRSVRAVQSTGTQSGVWCAEGQAGELPGDQRPDDALSVAFDFEQLSEPLEILGSPVVRLDLEADKPQALVAVRLSEVFADGSSTLVTRGVLNLAHRESHETPSALEPGAHYAVRVLLDVAGHSFAAGSRLRVAVSSAYWPWLWPSPEEVTLTLHSGSLEVPVRPARAEDGELPEFGEPEHSPRLEIEERDPGPAAHVLRRDLATGLVEKVFDWDLGGSLRLIGAELETSDASHCVYSIVEGDPLSAKVEFRASSGMGRGDWGILSEVTSSMTSDRDTFHVQTRLDVIESGEHIFSRDWSFSIPRDHI